MADPASQPADGPVTLIHVSGAVRRPGLVELRGQVRVADAISAAGGVLPDADLTVINLAASLRDGDQVVVPLRSPGGERDEGVGADGRVRLNAAGIDELQQLPGVGPVLAGRIVDHRDSHGRFETVEDLLDVPGIGEAKLAALRDAVVVP